MFSLGERKDLTRCAGIYKLENTPLRTTREKVE
jgi:hypothetical protein